MDDCKQQFARGGAESTVELFEQLIAAGGKTNFLISPFSIQACMALAFSGAKGDTATEIASVMKYYANSPKEVAENFRLVLKKYKRFWQMANKIYLQKGNSIKPEFAAVTKLCNAEAENVDFCESQATAQAINQGVPMPQLINLIVGNFV